MRRKIKNITLTPNQQVYVRRNYRRMTFNEMANNLGIFPSRISENMQLMGIEKQSARARIIEIPETKNGFFDVDKYAKIAMI